MIDLTRFKQTLDGKPVLVFGLGISGGALIKALKSADIPVIIGDDNPQALAEMKPTKGVTVLQDRNLDFSTLGALILSPGIPLTHPEPHWSVQAAKDANIEIIGDIELFARGIGGGAHPTIGVTGTNGKSTTVSLIAHILTKCKLNAQLGGNIGRPVFELDMSKDNAIAVLELSSFQIDLCPTFRPDISVLLNLTPDHIDRHGTMENYAEVKERIFDTPHLHADGHAIIASDDPYCEKILARARENGLRRITEVSITKDLNEGVFVRDGKLFEAQKEKILQIGNIEDIAALKGQHNYQNAACAYAAARAYGLEPEPIFAAMQSFPGLQHRQFLTRTINGVGYINDSKATNAAATAMALACHNNIYWIVGGRKKKNGLDGLEEFFPRIKHAFLIGESVDDFSEWFDKYGMEYTRCGTMAKAVEQAHAMAQENRGQPGGAGVLLLSPACASYDQYKNFEERGDHFTALVADLTEDL